jgi:hypothetical protein
VSLTRSVTVASDSMTRDDIIGFKFKLESESKPCHGYTSTRLGSPPRHVA